MDAVLLFAKIAGANVLLAGVMAAVSALTRQARLSAEEGRKLIHVSLGLSCLALPVLFTEAWQGVLCCAVGAGVFALARGVLRRTLGDGLHSVMRRSYGEMLFAVSVALLFWLRPGDGLGDALFVLPILILALSDALAALVGVRWGRTRFRVGRSWKSVEGVAAFFASALALALIVLMQIMPLPQAVALSLAVATFGALMEAVSWRGLDNLLIPLGVFGVLAGAGADARLALAVIALASVSLGLVMSGPRMRRIARIAIGAAGALVSLASLAAAAS